MNRKGNFWKIWKKNSDEYIITDVDELIQDAESEGLRIVHVGALSHKEKERIRAKGIEILEQKEDEK